jgi:hypothetical protein
MPDINFTVENLNLIGSDGYASIDSDNTIEINSKNYLNLNADTVGISTDITIGGQVASDLIIAEGFYVGIGTDNPTSALTVNGNSELIGAITIKGAIYETTTSNFSDTLNPSSGTLTLSVSNSSVLVGALGSTVTTWAFTGVDTSDGSSITLTTIIDSNSLYAYGDSCTVNGVPITGGIRWAGGIPPISTNNEDLLSFTIITDKSSETRVYGSYQLNYS